MPSGLHIDAHHRPAFCPAPGLAGLLVPSLPERACGTTGRFTAPAAPCANTWPPCAKAHGNNKSLGRRSSPAFRTRMDFAVCSMSQGRRLRRRLPVRANCRPDMHLDRPPVLPASAPVRVDRIFRSLTSGARHRGGHPHPAPHHEDARDAPSHWNETGTKILGPGAESMAKIDAKDKSCEEICEENSRRHSGARAGGREATDGA